jgi:FKBP-type peptidyl-prolyl cis-trans isomerase SlpA
LHKGLVISFADASKAELPGVVSEFDEQQVVVNFNHPLAGHTISFDVQIVDVELIGAVKS